MASPPRAPCPAFWVRKMRSLFVLFDRDGDGIVHKDDFMLVATRAKMFQNRQKTVTIETVQNNGWDVFWGGPNKDYSTIDEMIEKHKALFLDPSSRDKIVSWLVTYFDALADGRDYMTYLDYEDMLYVYGVHPLSVPPSFQALDANGDGLISREEFVKAEHDFVMKTVDTPAKLFWGPMLA